MIPVKILLDLQNPLLFTLVESPSKNVFLRQVFAEQKTWVKIRGIAV